MLQVFLGLLGCVDDATRPAPTYNEDVAPVLAANCVECHRSGGIAPFPLESYADARDHALAMADAVSSRTMPPFNLDNSGACNTYLDARWLTDEEIATITDWADAGAPEGAPATEPTEAPEAWSLERVDLTVEMPEAYTPDPALEDDYRCFVVDPGLTEDQYITGFQVHLGEPRMVHHMTLFALDTAEDEQEAEALDAAEPGPGYTCFGSTIAESRWLVGSGPGDPGSMFPKGTGMPMSAGRKVVLQMHYNSANGRFTDRTRIDLELEPTVPHPARVERVAAEDLRIPPNKSRFVASDTAWPGANYTMWGVWPHMHNLGTALEVTRLRGKSERCVADADRYQFHWQSFEFFTRPVHLRAKDRLRVSCTYDSTGRDTPTRWGEGTDDEMCIAFFYVTED